MQEYIAPLEYVDTHMDDYMMKDKREAIFAEAVDKSDSTNTRSGMKKRFREYKRKKAEEKHKKDENFTNFDSDSDGDFDDVPTSKRAPACFALFSPFWSLFSI